MILGFGNSGHGVWVVQPDVFDSEPLRFSIYGDIWIGNTKNWQKEHHSSEWKLARLLLDLDEHEGDKVK